MSAPGPAPASTTGSTGCPAPTRRSGRRWTSTTTSTPTAKRCSAGSTRHCAAVGRRRHSTATRSCSGWPTAVAGASGRRRHRDRALQDDAGARHRQRPGACSIWSAPTAAPSCRTGCADALARGELIVNLRAEGDPERLQPGGRRRWPTADARGAASPRRSSTASTSGRAGRSRRIGWRRHDRGTPRILYCHCAYAKVVPARRQGRRARTAWPRRASSSTRYPTCAKCRRTATTRLRELAAGRAAAHRRLLSARREVAVRLGRRAAAGRRRSASGTCGSEQPAADRRRSARVARGRAAGD